MTQANKMLYKNLTGYGQVVQHLQLAGVSSVGSVANATCSRSGVWHLAQLRMIHDVVNRSQAYVCKL